MQDTEKKRLEDILNSEMEKLSELTSSYVDRDVSVRKMEMGYLAVVLMLCLNLLKFVISVKVIQKSGVRPKEMAGEKISSKGQRIRKYLSIFGPLEFSRTTYHSKDRGLMFVLDECLSFPPDLWSYNIQELIGGNASETGFRESVRLLNSLLNLNLSASGSERGIARLGNFVEEYYEHKSSPKPEGLVHLSASFDGKGVPKIIENKTQKGVFRLGKGEKRGLKQMATVAVMSWFRPKYRNSESCILCIFV